MSLLRRKRPTAAVLQPSIFSDPPILYEAIDWSREVPEIKEMLERNTPWTLIAAKYNVSLETILREVRDIFHLEKKQNRERREAREREKNSAK